VTFADCAPFVAPATLAAVIHVESGSNPFALHVNGLAVQPAAPRSKGEAVAMAQRFIALGYSVDLGRMQVNSRHLPTLGVTVGQVLEPHACDNIRVGADILAADYSQAAALYGEGQPALRAALSAYNTGSFYRGGTYVARYVGPTVPVLQKPSHDAEQLPAAPQSDSAPVSPYAADTAQAAATEWKEVSE
jgi:type IV secretion system protein VirB1